MIKVRGLTKKYGSFEALRNVSFEVKQGEILGFLGPNGAGKTTTMKVLTGYFPPTKGSIEIAGMSIDKYLLDIKRKIGYLPENVPLYKDMSVKDFLFFVAKIKKVPRRERAQEVNRVTSECSLDAVFDVLIKALSKGFRQRVGLAQALIGDPDILILDEPTIGLDPKQIIEIRKLIKGMAGKKTIILSSHILPEVSMVSDRVIVINEGKIVAIDTPSQLHNALQASTELSCVAEGDEAVIVEAIKRVPHVTQVRIEKHVGDAKQYIISSEKNQDVRAAVLRELVTQDHAITVLELNAISMSLEDIFLKLVTKEEGVS